MGNLTLLLWTVAVALVVSLTATPLMRRLALRYGVVASPNERSVHTQPIPYLGGAALFLGFAVAMLVFGDRGDSDLWGILVGGFATVLLGLLDDRFVLSPIGKFLGQVGVAAILVVFGVTIDYVTNPLTGHLVVLGYLSIPVTIGWVVLLVNVLNLIDGLDGLAAGISAIASFTLLVAAWQTGQALIALLLSAALFGSSLGFLPWNFNPAKIFMGDAGAMFLGYTLAAISIAGMLKSPTAIALAVPVLALGLPFFDTAFAIVRRWRAGRFILSADRDHLHHRLLQLGLSQRDTVLLMYFISGWLAISALAIAQLPQMLASMILLFVVISVVVAGKKMGILEIRTTKPNSGA